MEPREKKADEKFCFECGEIIRVKAEICPKCGCRQPVAAVQSSSDIGQMFIATTPKSRTTAAGLAILLGGVGVHKFYLGKPIQGILYVIFVWTFIPALFGFVEGLHYLTMTDPEFQSRLSRDTLNDLFVKN